MKTKTKTSKKQGNAIQHGYSSLRKPRIFSYEQLAKISNENYEVLNRSIDPDLIDKNSLFVLTPIMIHHHAFGLPVEPHVRAFVTCPTDKSVMGTQDLTFEQFATGIQAA